MTCKTPDDTPLLSDSLRASLRTLCRDVAPPAATWDRIAGRIAAPGHVAVPARRRRATARWMLPLALAASLAGVLAIGVWQVLAPPPAPETTAGASTPGDVRMQAGGLVREYRAALSEVGGARVTPALQPGLAELDRNAAQILAALQRDPDSALLLQQLRRTYARRLALSRRAALT
ncbi:hypothetical protein [Lysobacter sp. A3-1-A15]|uniref:hypothetical protein n=1 Tax=Novilysobacter viscosus TaxID=3098602 RepID=UPI002EDA2E35